MDYIKLANNGIQQLKPYEPGKPIEELERELGVTDIVKRSEEHTSELQSLE